MRRPRISTSIAASLRNVDWVFLCLMLGITQNRFFALKLVAAGLAAVLTPCLSYLRRPGIHLFYLAMAGWTVIQYTVIVREYSTAYSVVALYATLQWLVMALIAAMLASLANRDAGRSQQTIRAYFWIAAGLSMVSILAMMAQTGTVNPYEYAREPVYGMSSGDHVTGLYGFYLWTQHLGDYSNVNAAILSFFFLYFFYLKEWGKGSLALVLMLFTSSNAITISVLLLTGLVVTGTRKRTWFLAALCFTAVTLLFYTVVTPKNFSYAISNIAGKLGIHQAGPPKHQTPVTPMKITSRATQENPSGKSGGFDPQKQSGKVLSFKQTRDFVLQSPASFLFGNGPGRFSSQLALLAASKENKGRIFRPLSYQSAEYRQRHGQITAYVRSLPPEYHSMSQQPFSWYNQIWGEYGLIGFLLFAFFYVGWCVRKGWAGYGKYLLFLLLLLHSFDYTYETFCIVPVFEWLLLTGIATRQAAERS